MGFGIRGAIAMSQVLRYGVPVRERLLCESPGCTELATALIRFVSAPAAHNFACDQHKHQLSRQQAVHRYIILDEPGERNPPDEEKKNGEESKEA
jgi:hypothetical protein